MVFARKQDFFFLGEEFEHKIFHYPPKIVYTYVYITGTHNLCKCIC